MQKLIFVEGFYNELFFNKILCNLKINEKVKIFQYAQEKDEKITRYISSLKAQEIEYLFIADLDNNDYPSRIEALKKRYSGLSENNMVLVNPEIEGWYIAGLSKKSMKILNLRNLPNPNECTKEIFIKRLPNQMDGAYIRTAILDCYEIETAIKNSTSFKNFIEKIKSW